jgi:hypothetical protein
MPGIVYPPFNPQIDLGSTNRCYCPVIGEKTKDLKSPSLAFGEVAETGLEPRPLMHRLGSSAMHIMRFGPGLLPEGAGTNFLRTACKGSKAQNGLLLPWHHDLLTARSVPDASSISVKTTAPLNLIPPNKSA